MKIILDFDGDERALEQAIFERDNTTSPDSAFDLFDSILWEASYGEDGSIHPTDHGTFKITVERGEEKDLTPGKSEKDLTNT